MHKLLLALNATILTLGCNKLDRPTSSSSATSTVTRDLTFAGVEFTPHESHPIKVALIDRDLDARIFTADISISSGKFSLNKEKVLVDGHRYFLDYFADVNGNHNCDAPPTDHVWRIPIDAVSSNVSVTDTHKMNFHDSCSSFKDVYVGPTGDMTILITGRLLLGDSVTDAQGMTQGQALVGAKVFVEGLADQDAVTDSSGAFRLAITVPKDMALSQTEKRLVMWYTQPKPGKTSTDWDIAEARFGAIKSIPLSANLNVGDQRLSHTKAVKFRVVSAVDQGGISTCWVRSPAMGANLVVSLAADGNYTVDYLPPGSYELAVTCQGYQSVNTTISVGEATTRSTSEVAPDVVVTPNN